MTVYIVTPFRPDAIMEDELSTENKAVDGARILQKLRAHRDPVPTFVLECKVASRPLYSLGDRARIQALIDCASKSSILCY